MHDNNKPMDQTPKGAHTPTKGLGTGTGILPEEVISLQEEMNRDMEHLLMTRSSLAAHRRKQVSDFQAALHQNQVVATESIREATAHCTMAIREAESHCATDIREVVSHCGADIREAEAHSVAQACSIQQSHSEDMQHLRTDTLEKEGRGHLSFLSVCEVTLQACPPDALGIVMYPLHLITGNMSLATLLCLTHQASTTRSPSSTCVLPRG